MPQGEPKPAADDARVRVWCAMAEHYLDTETRHQIPATALHCVAAGLSHEQVRDVWEHEVTPALLSNLWAVGGDWSGWDESWLVSRIQQVRNEHPGLIKRGWRRLVQQPMRGYLHAVERCVEVLKSHPNAEQTANDLTILARHYLDFLQGHSAEDDLDSLDRLRALYPEPLLSVLKPVAQLSEAGKERIKALLSTI